MIIAFLDILTCFKSFIHKKYLLELYRYLVPCLSNCRGGSRISEKGVRMYKAVRGSHC